MSKDGTYGEKVSISEIKRTSVPSRNSWEDMMKVRTDYYNWLLDKAEQSTTLLNENRNIRREYIGREKTMKVMEKQLKQYKDGFSKIQDENKELKDQIQQEEAHQDNLEKESKEVLRLADENAELKIKNKWLKHDLELWKSMHEPITEDQPMSFDKLRRIQEENKKLSKRTQELEEIITRTPLVASFAMELIALREENARLQDMLKGV